MKVLLIVALCLIVVVAAILIVGVKLPVRHVVTRSAEFHATPDRLFALIAGTQTWRPDVKSCQELDQDGRHYQIETSKYGKTIKYELEGARPPFAIERRIATRNLPYAGTWYISLETESDGPSSETRVEITEDGEVYNPVFRFLSKFVIGQTATQDAYLKALGKATGENSDIKIIEDR